MPDGKTVQVEGRSTNQGLVFALLDRLKANKNFANVQMPYLREAAGGGGGGGREGNRAAEMSFTIQFTYQPAPATAPAAAAAAKK